MKKLRYSLVIVMLTVVSLPAVARAVCVRTGYVERVTVDNVTTAIFLRESSLAANFFTFATTDSKLANAVLHALESGTLVRATSNPADVCTINNSVPPFATLLDVIVKP